MPEQLPTQPQCRIPRAWSPPARHAEVRAAHGGGGAGRAGDAATGMPFDRGVVGMARSQNPNSANSQFFIMFAEGSFLNGQYTVFGQVRSGMEFVDNITKGAGQNGTSFAGEPDTMIAVTLGADG